ncbi:hypothetical protein J2Y48_004528 [Mycoplana sp. BE70]|nr:hypothetical protein [Mycoplana sp. BE70]
MSFDRARDQPQLLPGGQFTGAALAQAKATIQSFAENGAVS